MKITSLLILVLFINFSNLSAQTLNTFFTDADSFMKKWVKNGYINYGDLKEQFNEIEALQKQINNINLSNASDLEKKAFYINAYNLLVIYQVTKYYPLKSPLDKSGFFDKFNHKVAGETVTLNRIEKKYLILKYRDPRIHFAVACAAVSCPPLSSFAFVPHKIEQQLNERTRKAMEHEFVVKINKAEKKLQVSKIFDWYAVDFGKSQTSVIDFINKNSTKKIPTDYSVSYQEYDWSLNKITD